MTAVFAFFTADCTAFDTTAAVVAKASFVSVTASATVGAGAGDGGVPMVSSCMRSLQRSLDEAPGSRVEHGTEVS